MRRFLTAIAALILLSIPAFAQVDTLMLVEINSIEVPSNITEIYTESIRDNIKEIFICTNDHIYCYDSQTNELIWSRGELIHPTDLQFGDINNDGFTDIAFRDSLNIFLYDVVNQDNIWTSPALDSTFKCYTIGDRNDDGWIDAVIVSKEPFTRYQDWDNLDTVWIDLFNGPDFSEEIDLICLLSNYSYSYGGGMDYYEEQEIPNKVGVSPLWGDNGIISAVILLTNSSSLIHHPGGNDSDVFSGKVYIYDGISFNLKQTSGCRSMIYYDFFEISYSFYLYVLGYSNSYGSWDGGYYSYDNIAFSSYSADTLFFSRWLWYRDNDNYSIWKGFQIGNIIANYNGNELCTAAMDSLYLYNIPTNSLIWATTGIEDLTSVDHIFKSQIIFEAPTIMCKISGPEINYHFFNGETGLLEAVLRGNYIFTSVTDLNTDGNDEILSIDGNTLRIYHLDYAVDIDQPVTVPYHTFIQPNYPNPFNAATTIEYGLKQDDHVTIDIYDLLGRRVTTLIDETKPAGLYQATWQAEDIPSGVYFYKIQTGDYSKTRKMMLLK